MLLALGGTATATVISDDAGELSLDVMAAGATTCILFPTAQRDATACAGVPEASPQALAQLVGRQGQDAPVLVTVALLRFPDWAVMAMLMRDGTPPRRVPFAEDIDERLRGVADGVRGALDQVQVRGVAGGGRDLLSVNGTPVVRAWVSGKARAGTALPFDHFLFHQIVQVKHHHTLMLVTDAAHTSQVEGIAAAMLGTLKVPPAPPEAYKLFNKPQAYAVGYHLGNLLFWLLVLVVPIWLLLRRRRRKKAAAQAGVGAA
jgi:hypothetical protein